MNSLKTLFADHGRKLAVGLWLLAPVALLGFHYGPGQRGVAGDAVARATDAALAAESRQEWSAAAQAWRSAVAEVPEGDVDARTDLSLKYQMARVRDGQLPEAMEETAALLDSAAKSGASAATQREVRTQLAAMHYWAAWLMRLEGASAQEWEPVADYSRQNFRLLAETEPAGDDAQKRNVEAVIRLQRMDLSELQGLPLPKQCKGNKNCTGKCKSQREGRCNKLGDKKKDARGEVKKEKSEGSGAYNAAGGGY